MRFYSNGNVTIRGNNISGYPVLLKSQGTENITHDLSNYWLRSFQSPEYLVDRTDLYLANDWNNASTTFNVTNGGAVILRALLAEGYGGSTTVARQKTQFEIHRSYMWFKSTNVSSRQINLYNLTNALVFNINGTPYCTDINACDGNVNITGLALNNESYVLDSFNLTEGVSRQFSPIWISYSSGNIRNISSNITTTNFTAIFNTSGIVPQSPRFRSHSGISTTSYAATEYFYNATAQTLQVNLTGVEQASGSNQFLFDTVGPSISILSPAEGLSQVGNFNVLFNLSASDGNSVSTYWYSVDGAPNVTFSGATIVNNPSGSHNVIFCANDTAGNTECTQSVGYSVAPTPFGGFIAGGGGSGSGSGGIFSVIADTIRGNRIDATNASSNGSLADGGFFGEAAKDDDSITLVVFIVAIVALLLLVLYLISPK